MPSPYCERKLFVKDESDGSILVDDETLICDYKNITLDRFKIYRLSTEVKDLRHKVEDVEYTIICKCNFAYICIILFIFHIPQLHIMYKIC